MKSQSILILAVVVLLAGLSGGVCAGTYSGGTGEPNDPYRIATAEDLNDIGNHPNDWNKHFLMVNDINLADYTGTEFNIIGDMGADFTGVFEGNNHKISNFTYRTTSRIYHIGLFRTIRRYGEVRGVFLQNVTVDAGSARWVGGLAGLNYGRVFGCRCTGKVSGNSEVGGLVGANVLGAITESSADCHVLGVISVGGLVGTNHSVIKKCWATGEVSGSASNANAGGLVGQNGPGGSVSNSYTTGRVWAPNYAGGLAGYNLSRVVYSFAVGLLPTGKDFIGGLVGCDNNGSYRECFWDTTVNPSLSGIGYTTDPKVVGKPRAEMMTASTFTDAGWDFARVWDIREDQTYPFLRKYSSSDINHDGKVNFPDVAIVLGEHWLKGTGP